MCFPAVAWCKPLSCVIAKWLDVGYSPAWTAKGYYRPGRWSFSRLKSSEISLANNRTFAALLLSVSHKVLWARNALLSFWKSYPTQYHKCPVSILCALFSLHFITNWWRVLEAVLLNPTRSTLNNKAPHDVSYLRALTWQIKLLTDSNIGQTFSAKLLTYV